MGSQKGMFWIVVVMKTLERKSQWRNFTKILNYIFKTYLYTPLVVIYFTGSLVIQYRKSFGWTFKFIRHQSLILLLRLWKRSESQKINYDFPYWLYVFPNQFGSWDHPMDQCRSKIFLKTKVSYPLIRTRRCAYQEVRNVSFSENFVYLLNAWSHSRIA